MLTLKDREKGKEIPPDKGKYALKSVKYFLRVCLLLDICEDVRPLLLIN